MLEPKHTYSGIPWENEKKTQNIVSLVSGLLHLTLTADFFPQCIFIMCNQIMCVVFGGGEQQAHESVISFDGIH